MLVLALLEGCLRFGYDPRPRDAGAQLDAGSVHDAGSPDAGQPRSMSSDAAVPNDAAMGVSKLDSGVRPADAAVPNDAGKPSEPAADSGKPDAGPVVATDAGSTQLDASVDAATDASPTSSACTFNITMNTYIGNGHYHGFLSLANSGTTTWALITIEFDLPVSMYVCNSANALPGKGWTLQTSAGHCSYTRTGSSVSIQPGATLAFEYSTNDLNAHADPAVANVKMSGCM